jgi:hypothetical protein
MNKLGGWNKTEVEEGSSDRLKRRNK